MRNAGRLIVLSIVGICFATGLRNDTTYYETGEIKRVKQYNADGKEDGVRKGFLRTGQQVLHAPFKEGVLHGLTKSWHDDGRPSQVSRSVNGNMHGWTVSWDTLGFPTDSTLYDSSRMVECISFYNGTRQIRKHQYYTHKSGDALLAMEDVFSRDGELISQVRDGNGFSLMVGENNTYQGIEIYEDGESDYRDFIPETTPDPRHKRKPLPESETLPWDPEKYGAIEGAQ